MKITAITRYKHGELYAILKRIGWKQSDLARQSQLRATTVGDIINLVKRPTVEQADAIQNALGTAGEYFDVLAEWPEVFEGLKRGYKREQTCEVTLDRLLDHPEVMQLPSPENSDDDREERVKSVLGTLTKAEQSVMIERFWNDKTFGEIGGCLNLSRDRIRQIEAKAIRKLRHPTRIRKLLTATNINEPCQIPTS